MMKKIKNYKKAFTLAEVLITLAIIGAVASLTIPSLIQKSQERQWVSALLKFNTNLQQAILLWKQEIGCNKDAKSCIVAENLVDNDTSAFEKTFGKYLKISKKTTSFGSVDWLPSDTLNYYGVSETKVYGKVAKQGSNNVVYLLADGTTLSMDFSPLGFAIYVDVNGMKPPNRIGKDTFPFTVGFGSVKDVYFGAYYPTATSHNTTGLCALQTSNCDPTNINPEIGSGANPTAYVILNQKLPDYEELSKTVTNFKP